MSIRVRKRAPLLIFAFHEFQQRIRDVRKREFITKIICFFKKNKNYTTQCQGKLVQLKEDGYLMVDNILSPEELESLIKRLKQLNCTDRVRKNLGMFTCDNIPSVTHVADLNDVVDIPEAIKFANNKDILNIVEGYLGAPPIVDSIMAWWSIPGFDEAEHEQFYHRDNDAIKFIKLFMYLTDVTETSGPHVFIKGSQRENCFEERRRFKDEEIETYFDKNSRVEYVGPLGTAFLEDTYGLHKGTLPEKDKRLLIQVRYSVMPSIFLNKTGTNSPDCLKEMHSHKVNRYLKAPQ